VKTSLATTHAGNYLSVCAAYAALRSLQEQGEKYYSETRAKVFQLEEKLSAFRNRYDVPLRLVGFGDFTGMLVFLPHDAYGDPREFAQALNPIAPTLLTLLLRQRGVYAADVPVVFTGGCHSQADIDRFYDAVADSVLEMKKNNFPFLLAW
jgi:glutamate-1-semialdehyde 2,1-aminomutase